MKELTVKDLIRILTNMQDWNANVFVLADDKQFQFNVYEDTTKDGYLELVIDDCNKTMN